MLPHKMLVADWALLVECTIPMNFGGILAIRNILILIKLIGFVWEMNETPTIRDDLLGNGMEH